MLLPPRRLKLPPRKAVPQLPQRKIYRSSVQQEFSDVQSETSWQKEWQGMPEFKSVDQLPFHTLKVHFENADDVQSFALLVGQKITEETKYIWHPKLTPKKVAHLRYTDAPIGADIESPCCDEVE